MSGVVMAGTSVPQLVAYAESVGYAGYRGLATAGPSLFVFGLTTGSPWLNAGVTSLSALMTKSDLNGDAYVAKYGEEEYVALVSAYSLYVGLASVLLVLVGFGTLAQSVPRTVRAGFKWGCALGVLNSALPNALLGRGKSTMTVLVNESKGLSDLLTVLSAKIPVAAGLTTLAKIAYLLTHPHLWTPLPAGLFVICTLFVMHGKAYLPKGCPPGTEVIIVTLSATIFSIYTDYGNKYGIVGEIPSIDAGMTIGPIELPIELRSPTHLLFNVPIVERCFHGSYALLGLTASIFAAINFLSVVGIASSFETEDGIPWSSTRELLAQGAACLAAAVTGSAPVSGSLSRSLVSRMAGTTSQVACLVTALCWMLLLPYMSIMTPTPKAALSAVIVSAVVRGVAVPRDLLKLTAVTDRLVGWGTGLTTACVSPTLGFAFGLILTFVISVTTKPSKKDKTT